MLESTSNGGRPARKGANLNFPVLPILTIVLEVVTILGVASSLKRPARLIGWLYEARIVLDDESSMIALSTVGLGMSRDFLAGHDRL